MSIAEDLEKLDQLHKSGALSDAEFAEAKAALLREVTPAPVRVPPEPHAPTDAYEVERALESVTGSDWELPSDGDDRTLGEAANRYVSFQMVMAVVGLILFLLFFFGFFLPAWRSPMPGFGF
jgi:hypothetical protein